jgi:hypothetical protein
VLKQKRFKIQLFLKEHMKKHFFFSFFTNYSISNKKRKKLLGAAYLDLEQWDQSINGINQLMRSIN